MSQAEVSKALRALKRKKFKTVANACKPVTISIRMKGGRTKKFVGRRGGAGRNGICGKPTAAVQRARSNFRRAVKACPKRGQAKLNCISKKLS